MFTSKKSNADKSSYISTRTTKLTTFSSKHSQSALEYMMTYGWAILIIVIVAAGLYSLGIFNPSSSAISSINGFAGFQATAICAPNGVLVLRLFNGQGYSVNITQINVTYNGKMVQNQQSGNNGLIAPNTADTFFSLSSCTNSSSAHYSSSISLSYMEPGQVFPGPYLSSGEIAGTSTSFSQNTVANLTNGWISQKNSLSFNKIWQAGTEWTLVAWINVKKLNANAAAQNYVVTESPGCSSGVGLTQLNISSTQINTTYFNAFSIAWSGGADTCTSTSNVIGGAITTSSSNANPVKYNTWAMVTGIFKYNGGNSGWIAICVNLNCVNNTYTNFAGGMANYSNPNQYTGYLGLTSNSIFGKMADVQEYDSILSVSQLNILYNLGYVGIPVTFKNLVAWYPLAGNTNDYSGNENGGTGSSNLNWVSP